jgi:hypothetical protein
VAPAATTRLGAVAERLLEAEAVEELDVDDGSTTEVEAPARPLPERITEGGPLSPWSGEVTTVALAAAGGAVAGAATVAVARAVRAVGSGRGRGRPGRKERQTKGRIVASRSFLVDVHLLDR